MIYLANWNHSGGRRLQTRDNAANRHKAKKQQHGDAGNKNCFMFIFEKLTRLTALNVFNYPSENESMGILSHGIFVLLQCLKWPLGQIHHIVSLQLLLIYGLNLRVSSTTLIIVSKLSLFSPV